MKYAFHPEARLEYLEAAAFYEKRRAGLGAAFTVEVEATFQGILKKPERFRTLDHDVHTCRAHTFPYAILYTIEEGFILVIAVMHLRHKPGYWRHRLPEHP